MIEVCYEVAKKLINLGNIHDIPQNNQETILFPKYRSNNIRISEQESKILLSNYFLNNNVPFSIEAPTMSMHSFSGKTKLSGRFDLVTYKANKERLEFDWIIELKAHNAQHISIQKDFEKMLVSNCNCLWFHTLKNENQKTIPTILEKINNSFKKLSSKIEFNSSKKLLLVFVVIDKKLLYSTEFQFIEWQTNSSIDYKKLTKIKLV